MSLLKVSGLTVQFADADRPALDGFELSMKPGECVGLVGESGSGKTQAALALLGLNAPAACVSGSIQFDGEELLGTTAAAWRGIRARRIAMVFQDPNTALNPYRRVGEQLGMVLEAHGLAQGAGRHQRVLDSLRAAGLPDPERQVRAYPHELSGGMRQRVMIASALIAEPELLIADEPTTAIDATIQAQILELLRELRAKTGVAMLLISHDLGMVAGHSDRLLVLHEGRVVESGATREVFANPVAAQTRAMLAAVSNPEPLAPDMQCERRKPLLEVRDLSVCYGTGRHELKAVRPTSFVLRPGETLAVVGESGSGKTSLVRAVLGLTSPESGTVVFLGRTLPAELKARSVAERREMQLVFQDPAASLDPAMRVGRILEEPLCVHQPGLDRQGREAETRLGLERVGLDASFIERFPHELSGGEAQRIAIARALAVKPQVLICDEAVASLDSHVRRGLLELLAEQQRRTALSIVFISHDLQVVRQFSHRVMVLYMGQVFEVAESARLFRRPRHPYSQALIHSSADFPATMAENAAPLRATMRGEIPSSPASPEGCLFHPRCGHSQPACRARTPETVMIDGTRVACHRAEELDLTI